MGYHIIYLTFSTHDRKRREMHRKLVDQLGWKATTRNRHIYDTFIKKEMYSMKQDSWMWSGSEVKKVQPGAKYTGNRDGQWAYLCFIPRSCTIVQQVGLRLGDSKRKTSKWTHVLARLANGNARSQPLDGEFPIMSLVNSTLRAKLHNKNITRLCH
jgi:hypothetical protein